MDNLYVLLTLAKLGYKYKVLIYSIVKTYQCSIPNSVIQ